MPILISPLLWARLWKKATAILFAAAILFALSATDTRAQEISKEYQIKAVFLFNFTQFVTWPENTFSNAQSPFVIGILGDDPFGNYLDETVRGEKMGAHPLIIQRYRSIKDVGDCQILFISPSERKKLDSIFNGLKGRKILTVSDIENFSEDGGIIGFTTVGNKIHFAVNLDAAKDTGLTISSKLLRLAKIVETQKE